MPHADGIGARGPDHLYPPGAARWPGSLLARLTKVPPPGGGPRISLHADAGRRLAGGAPDGREMMISCGAALFPVRLAPRALGCIPETPVLPDPGQPTLVARVSWRERAGRDWLQRAMRGP